MINSSNIDNQIDLISFIRLITSNFRRIILISILFYCFGIFTSIIYFDRYTSISYTFDRSSFTEVIHGNLKELNSTYNQLTQLGHIKEIFLFQNKNYKNFSQEEMGNIVIFNQENVKTTIDEDGLDIKKTRFLPQSIISMISTNLKQGLLKNKALQQTSNTINNSDSGYAFDLLKLKHPSVFYDSLKSVDPFDKFMGISNNLSLVVEMPNDKFIYKILNKDKNIYFLENYFQAFLNEAIKSINKEILLSLELELTEYDYQKEAIINKLLIQNQYYVERQNEKIQNTISELERDSLIAVQLNNDGSTTVRDGTLVDLSNTGYLRGYIPIQNEIKSLREQFNDTSLIPGYLMNIKIIEQLKADIFLDGVNQFMNEKGLNNGEFIPFIINDTNIKLNTNFVNPFLNILSLTFFIAGIILSLLILSIGNLYQRNGNG